MLFNSLSFEMDWPQRKCKLALQTNAKNTEVSLQTLIMAKYLF